MRRRSRTPSWPARCERRLPPPRRRWRRPGALPGLRPTDVGIARLLGTPSSGRDLSNRGIPLRPRPEGHATAPVGSVRSESPARRRGDPFLPEPFVLAFELTADVFVPAAAAELGEETLDRAHARMVRPCGPGTGDARGFCRLPRHEDPGGGLRWGGGGVRTHRRQT